MPELNINSFTNISQKRRKKGRFNSILNILKKQNSDKEKNNRILKSDTSINKEKAQTEDQKTKEDKIVLDELGFYEKSFVQDTKLVKIKMKLVPQEQEPIE